METDRWKILGEDHWARKQGGDPFSPCGGPRASTSQRCWRFLNWERKVKGREGYIGSSGQKRSRLRDGMGGAGADGRQVKGLDQSSSISSRRKLVLMQTVENQPVGLRGFNLGIKPWSLTPWVWWDATAGAKIMFSVSSVLNSRTEGPRGLLLQMSRDRRPLRVWIPPHATTLGLSGSKRRSQLPTLLPLSQAPQEQLSGPWPPAAAAGTDFLRASQ